jgi:PhnB protein
MFSTSFSLSRADWLINVEDHHHIWPGLNWDSPMLVVPNVSRAIQFYEKVFSFIPVFILPDENNDVTFARMRYRGTHFTLTCDTEHSHAVPSLLFIRR